MCGRYVLKILPDGERLWLWKDSRVSIDRYESYNIAPTDDVPVLRMLDAERRVDLLRWGLVPYFARGVPPSYSTINATIEKLETAPAWRGPWSRSQRCLMPANGFYEWQALDAKTKQPYYITAADQEVFAFAAVWDRSVADDGTFIESCALVTMPANDFMARIHNTKRRQPFIVRAEDREAWLTGSIEEARAVLQRPDENLRAHPVGKAVGSPRNNDRTLIAPVETRASQQLF